MQDWKKLLSIQATIVLANRVLHWNHSSYADLHYLGLINNFGLVLNTYAQFQKGHSYTWHETHMEISEMQNHARVKHKWSDFVNELGFFVLNKQTIDSLCCHTGKQAIISLSDKTGEEYLLRDRRRC